MKSYCFLFLIVFVSAVFQSINLPAAPVEVTIAADGKALLPVVVAPAASKRIRKAAATLAEFLGRLSNAAFKVEEGDGSFGIALGLDTDFPELQTGIEFDRQSPLRREDYLLRTHERGIYLLGTTELAVENALWDLLHRFGFRQFFPGENWEVLPPPGDLRLALDAFEQPDYSYRRIWYGYGSSWDGGAHGVWCERNRMRAAFQVSTTHTYSTIIEAFPEVFKKHPEYQSHVNGKPTSKLNIAQPGLRQLVVRWALERLEKNPRQEVIPLDPSDGGGWGQSEAELTLGPISNRVVMLANEVAEAINERFAAEYGTKYVGIYAYNEHALPPTIKVHPNVIVLVATAFNKSGLTIEQLMEGWQRQGATIGIRDYYSVTVWHKDRPGGPNGADPRRVAEQLRHHHQLGARFMSSESGNNWGPGGLGHYVAARLLWNVNENYEAIVDDFFARAFGPAEPPMREFYRLIDRASKPVLTKHLVGSMYRQLHAARELTEAPGILKRLEDLVLYTRYVELLLNIGSPAVEVEMPLREPAAADMSEADLIEDVLMGNEQPAPPIKITRKQDGSERALSFAYRIRKRNMVHSLALWRDTRGGGFKPLSSTAHWQVPEAKHPWKNSDPFTPDEINKILSAGIADNPVFTVEQVSFSSELEPAVSLRTPARPRLPARDHTRMNIFYTWVGPEKEPVRLEVTVRAGADAQPGRVFLQRADKPYAAATVIAVPEAETEAEAEAPENAEAEAEAEADAGAMELDDTVPPTPQIEADDSVEIRIVEEPQQIALQPAASGLYRVIVQAVGRRTYVKLDWPEEQPMAHAVEYGLSIYHRYERYFYVPSGTVEVAGLVQGSGVVRDADGTEVFRAPNQTTYFQIPVPPGQGGRLWHISGAIRPVFKTVPPYLFRSEKDLLLPRELLQTQ